MVPLRVHRVRAWWSARQFVGLFVGGFLATGVVAHPAAAQTCSTFSAVTANGDDGHVPANAIDGSLATRWSRDGVGSWIQGDLGSARSVGAVRVAWYQGDQRTNNLAISLSTDGSAFSQVFTGVSSGTTLSPEIYTFPAVSARYVRVTVNGNSVNDWASITEFGVPAFVGVTASGDDGHVPANVNDGDLSTRWSRDGIGSWIRGDLGSIQSIGSVQVAWYLGNQRTNNVVLATSTDDVSYTNVFTGTSSGSTTSLETYSFAATNARYVRVTVNGNSQNTFASITEIAVGCGSGGGGTPGTDPNGTTQIYVTKDDSVGDPVAGAWTLGFGDWQTRTRSFGTVSGAGVNTIVRQSGQVRMTVKATTSTCEGLQDHGQALAQGYMCSARDWTNVEMTGYFKLNNAAGSSSDQDWTMYGNGGRHTGDGPPVGCMGSAYKGSYHYKNADNRFAKESWHVNYDYLYNWASIPGGVDYTQESSRWLGMKFIRYEFARNAKRGVRVELWLDFGGVNGSGVPANQWHLYRAAEDHPDSPSWGSQATECNAALDDQVMLWGGPWVTWRWDNTDSSLRLMSVREIVPPTNMPPIP